jgi:hypothetical protein
MGKASKPQKETVERVMHEFKHGELESGSGRKVKSRKQAVAIALHEAGESKFASKAENARSLRRSKAKERRGETAMQEKEGKGALRKRLSERGTRKSGTSRRGAAKTTRGSVGAKSTGGSGKRAPSRGGGKRKAS